MKTRDKTREHAMELALQHKNSQQIADLLEEQGLGGILDRFEIESIVVESESVRRMLPERPSKILPRIIGLIAVIIGIAGIWIGVGNSFSSNYSLAGYGIVAVILGIILIFKPYSAKSEI
jgi:uncharacterized protein YjeT (DUF2065 family)